MVSWASQLHQGCFCILGSPLEGNKSPHKKDLVHLFDQPERSVIDEEGKGEEDDAGDDHHPGESPQRQLASKQDSVQISEDANYVKV